jgi:small conductance mechanosensitive channel
MTLENFAKNNMCAEIHHSCKITGRQFRFVRTWVILLTATLVIFTPAGLDQAQDQTVASKPVTVIALSLFGIDMILLLAAFGGTSFIIGFAMQSTLSNLASGLLLMVTKPFDVGDVIETAEVAGAVQNASDVRRVDLTFGIGYDDDIELARHTLLALLVKHPLVLDEPEPIIRVHDLADSSVNIICRPWMKSDDYWNVYWDLMQQAKERFNAVGLSISFPQRDVHVYPAETNSTGITAQ